MNNRTNGIIGITAVIMSSCTIIITAALRTDGYNHYHKAISELGSVDAPNKWIFNILGFIIPGILLTIFSKSLLNKFHSYNNVRHYPFYLFISTGPCLALVGVPADMDNVQSINSIIHIIGSTGGGILWLLCALTLWWQLKKIPSWKPIAIVTFSIPFIMLLAMSFVPENNPGIIQRISVTCNYAFISILAIKQLNSSYRKHIQSFN